MNIECNIEKDNLVLLYKMFPYYFCKNAIYDIEHSNEFGLVNILINNSNDILSEYLTVDSENNILFLQTNLEDNILSLIIKNGKISIEDYEDCKPSIIKQDINKKTLYIAGTLDGIPDIFLVNAIDEQLKIYPHTDIQQFFKLWNSLDGIEEKI